jgi:cytochrome c oxidase subunit IV
MMYYTVFMALMVLTVVTWAITYVDLGEFNLVLALAVAITKAMLVIVYFMHMKWSPKLFKVTIGSSVFFLMIMFALTLSDYMSRGQYGLPQYPTAVATGTGSNATPPPVTPTGEGHAPAAPAGAKH